MGISRRLKKYLIANKISEKSLSEVTGISMTKLKSSLDGNRNLSFDEFELILMAIDEPADKFLIPKKMKY
ncbi:MULTISPECIES: HTH domain-containing protein [unclassified Clostridioides]|uniref:HTH domain-containing protein n=1 Tax=unclassified Clostridioides TaxID=2635829 RepID=UPI001D119137|nr:hypothetical protein [Clostridioides sp. ES-W-0018-02]MCC0705135.1 hypothetical protein [Clostridioides sp. ES-S-0049-02]MCC0713036.1 hypothetical protein [Clostridioides sp. ES-W-0017-02]